MSSIVKFIDLLDQDLNKLKADCEEVTTLKNNLNQALKTLRSIESADEVLKHYNKQSILDLQRRIRNTEADLERKTKSMEEHKIALAYARQYRQKTCDHNFVFTHFDPHKREDFYTCTKCNLKR